MGVNPLELIQGTGNSITHQSSRSAQSRKVWYKKLAVAQQLLRRLWGLHYLIRSGACGEW
jgi:hypothetical protein